MERWNGRPVGRRAFRSPWARVLLCASAILGSAVVAEWTLRVWDPFELDHDLAQSERDWESLLHRASSLPGLAYELYPNREGAYSGVPIAVNSHGMRDDEPLPNDTPGLVRLAALGDSFTFGFGVGAAETYPNVLEQLLERRRGRASTSDAPARYEVLNFGVGGYSTLDELKVLEHRALAYRPRAVLLGYYFNDPETRPIQPLHAHFHRPSLPERSYLWRWLRGSARTREFEQLGGGNYYRALHAEAGPYWSGVERAFAATGQLLQSAGIPGLVVIFPKPPPAGWTAYELRDLHAQVEAAARRAGLDVLDLLADFEQLDPRLLCFAPDDPHPTVLAHRRAARAIFEKITRDHPAVLVP